MCTPLRQEFVLLSSVLVDAIASEGKGEYMYVEKHVHTTNRAPIPGARSSRRGKERDASFRSALSPDVRCCHGFNDVQFAVLVVADCRSRLVTDEDRKYHFQWREFNFFCWILLPRPGPCFWCAQLDFSSRSRPLSPVPCIG
jgi:hypothetical protein